MPHFYSCVAQPLLCECVRGDTHTLTHTYTHTHATTHTHTYTRATTHTHTYTRATTHTHNKHTPRRLSCLPRVVRYTTPPVQHVSSSAPCSMASHWSLPNGECVCLCVFAFVCVCVQVSVSSSAPCSMASHLSLPNGERVCVCVYVSVCVCLRLCECVCL